MTLRSSEGSELKHPAQSLPCRQRCEPGENERPAVIGIDNLHAFFERGLH